VLEVGATLEKSHVRMMSCACGRRSMGNVRANKSGSLAKPHTICGDTEGGGPRVHHVGIANEAAGLTPLRLGVAIGDIG
jgi:hypothetical protein